MTIYQKVNKVPRMSANKPAKKTRVRYTPEKREEILTYISQQGRGGQSKAIKKYGVTAATLTTWRKQEGLIAPSVANKAAKKNKAKAAAKAPAASPTSTAGISNQLQAIQDLGRIAGEIAEAEAKLASLRKEFEAAKSKI